MKQMHQPPTRHAHNLFVYGLLMHGYRYHHWLRQGRYRGTGTAAGRLLTNGEFPAMVEGDGVVHGEVYHFDDIGRILESIDLIEGFDPRDPAGSLYCRVERTVHLADGEVVAWLYLYNRPVEAASSVPSGNWRDFAP